MYEKNETFVCRVNGKKDIYSSSRKLFRYTGTQTWRFFEDLYVVFYNNYKSLIWICRLTGNQNNNVTDIHCDPV